jgi:uncharacterized membrane protein YhaH (DUF805 family)
MLGRLGSLSFIVLFLSAFAVYFAIGLLTLEFDVLPTQLFGLAAILYCFGAVVLVVGRLHDAGYSGWWWLLIALTSLLGLLAVAATPGEKAPNKYGDVPKGLFGNLIPRKKHADAAAHD